MEAIMDSIKRIPEDLHSPALTFGESVLGDAQAVAADDVTAIRAKARFNKYKIAVCQAEACAVTRC